MPLPKNPSNASDPIGTAAAYLLLASVVFCLAAAWFLTSPFSIRPMFFHNESASFALLNFAATLQILFSLIGIVTFIGLLKLKENARKAALFLSTVPIALLLFATLFFINASNNHPYSMFIDIGTIGLFFCGTECLVLLPLSIWWFILFRRDKIRSQFR